MTRMSSAVVIISLAIMGCSDDVTKAERPSEQPARPILKKIAPELPRYYVPAPPPHIAEWTSNEKVFFAKGSAQLSSEAKERLDKQAAWLKCHYQGRITAEGHADARGSREFNFALAERRATAVRRYLIEHGLQATSIRIVSYGKDRPVALGDGEAAWEQNRRVVVTLDGGEVSRNCKP